MTRVLREDWLDIGLKVLVEAGPEALTIERMCRDLGITKGAFYHRFGSGQAFRKALLDHWEAKYTKRFIVHSQQEVTPQAQLERLGQLVVDTHDGSEVPLRAWAQIDPFVRTYQERIDRRRIAYVTALLQATGLPAAEARTGALLYYATLIGAAEMRPPATRAELAAMFAAITQRVTKQPDRLHAIEKRSHS